MARPQDGRPLSAGDENQIDTDLTAIATEVDHLLKHAGIRAETKKFIPLPCLLQPLVLLTRAELYRLKKDFAKAQHDIDEAFTIATRGGMRLHEADCHLEYARLHLAKSENDKARESWAKAKKMIEEMGYHRRDPEIHLIEAQFHLTSGEKDKVRESLANAKELIDKMGMHRWDIEVKEIKEQLGGTI